MTDRLTWLPVSADSNALGTPPWTAATRDPSENEYIAGAGYTIADMAIWPWYGALAKGLVYDAGEFLQVQQYKNVQRWTDQIAARPAVKRGRMVNRVMGEPSSQLRERHDASDFDLRTQDKLEAEAAE